MNKLSMLVVALLLALPAHAQVWVDGYTRSDGTYVQGHYRSSPNNTKLDNYSTRGNINPYTGKVGTVDPYPEQSLSQPVYQPRVYQPQTYQPQTYQQPTYQQPARQSTYGSSPYSSDSGYGQQSGCAPRCSLYGDD